MANRAVAAIHEGSTATVWGEAHPSIASLGSCIPFWIQMFPFSLIFRATICPAVKSTFSLNNWQNDCFKFDACRSSPAAAHCVIPCERMASSPYSMVASKGGHKSLRVAIAAKERSDTLHQIVHEWVAGTGLLYEYDSNDSLAVDLPPGAQDSINLSTLEQWSANGDICMEINH
jgi:hypothetical protein